ncbi:MAG: PAS domain S-box protein [Dehalococcoidia bacterium]|nr:PAS domain S-box protein [Dehalococcoidia bacterium]
MDKTRATGRGGYLEGLLQSCPDAVIAIDAKGIITFVNKAAGELVGCEMRDLIGKSIVSVYESERHARETNRKLYLSGGVIHLHETKVRTAAGRLIPVRLSAAHMKDSAGNYTGSVGFMQAYRPWTEAETKLQDYCRQLESRLAEWTDLGAPVFELWPGLSMAVLVGRMDTDRIKQLKKRLLDQIVVAKSKAALVDLSAAVCGEAEVPAQLVKLFRMVRLVGAECFVVGIDSATMAETLEPLVGDNPFFQSYSSLEAGLKAALAVMDMGIYRKG